MSDKYTTISGNNIVEVEATVVSTGVAEAGDIIGLDSGGKIDLSMLPTGVGADAENIQAFENLSAGDFINVFLSGGIRKSRKADATTAGKEADGFTLTAVTAGSSDLIYFEGVNNQLSTMTIGAKQFLHTTAGARVETVPAATGNIYQYLGRAISATEVAFESGEPITRA